MPRLPFPADVPEGDPLHVLLRALHDLHGRAGRPGTRAMARAGHYSHSVVHALFTKARVPKYPVVIGVVGKLGELAPGTTSEAEIQRFELLWSAADEADGALQLAAASSVLGKDPLHDVQERRIADKQDDFAHQASEGASQESTSHQVDLRSHVPDAKDQPSENVDAIEGDLFKNADATPAKGLSDGLVVLVVDDDQPALEELAFLLNEDPRVATVLSAADSTAALRLLGGASQSRVSTWPDHAGVDVVFLDIRMPGLDGVELARVLSGMAVKPDIVFVTAHDDRAVDAYEVGAVDYMLKPLRTERLSGALDRIVDLRGAGGHVEPIRDDAVDDEVIPVELAGTTKLVPRSAVRYVEAQGDDYARLHTAEGSHLVQIPLSVLEERWRDAGFVRIHRSFLVAFPLVTDLRSAESGYVVRIGSGPHTVELPVSPRYSSVLKRRLALRD